MKIYHCYVITNKINNKKYIGQTKLKDPTKRWKYGHLHSLNNESILYRAMRKYGVHNFTFEVIACCKNIKTLNQLERQLIKQYNTYNGWGYNMTEGGEGASGRKMSVEERKKISERQTKNNTMKGRFGNLNPNYGMVGHLSPNAKRYKLTFKCGRIEEICGLINWCKLNGYTHQRLNKMCKYKKGKHKNIIKVEKI